MVIRQNRLNLQSIAAAHFDRSAVGETERLGRLRALMGTNGSKANPEALWPHSTGDWSNSEPSARFPSWGGENLRLTTETVNGC